MAQAYIIFLPIAIIADADFVGVERGISFSCVASVSIALSDNDILLHQFLGLKCDSNYRVGANFVDRRTETVVLSGGFSSCTVRTIFEENAAVFRLSEESRRGARALKKVNIFQQVRFEQILPFVWVNLDEPNLSFHCLK